jgi:hypothetical protein
MHCYRYLRANMTLTSRLVKPSKRRFKIAGRALVGEEQTPLVLAVCIACLCRATPILERLRIARWQDSSLANAARAAGSP